jgi:Ca-activated chloride channel family protein
MIEFANPLILLLLLVVPFLVWWWLRRPRGSLRYSVMTVLTTLPGRRGQFARWGGAGLRALGLALVIIAGAGPRWPDIHSRIATEGIAIEILVDVSGSMAELDFDWRGKPISRLDAAKKVFRLFVGGGEGPGGQILEGRSGDAIGLITFATWPESACPLTLSHGVLLSYLEPEKPWSVQPRTLPDESRTNIGDAIAVGLHRLEKARTARKVVVLLSDGEHNVPPPALKPRQAAQMAASMRVPIYAIDAGGETNVEEGMSTSSESQTVSEIRADGVETLQAIAKITGGRYFPAQDTETLLAVCGEIDRLERQDIQSFIYQRYYECYPWVGTAAILCWIAVVVLEATVWLRLP